MRKEPKNPSLSCLIIGACQAGKTSLLEQYRIQQFNDAYASTIEEQTETLPDVMVAGKTITLTATDLAGGKTDNDRSSLPSYYDSHHIVLVVFDMTNPGSFARAQALLLEIKQYKEHQQKQLHVVLVANKSDLTVSRQIATDEARNFAIQHGAQYKETSAQNHRDTQELFTSAAKSYLQITGQLQPKPTRAWYSRFTNLFTDRGKSGDKEASLNRAKVCNNVRSFS